MPNSFKINHNNNIFSTKSRTFSSKTPEEYVEYTAVGQDGRIFTPEDWSAFLDWYQYTSSMDFCRKYWSFDPDRSFDIKDFYSLYQKSVKQPNHNYISGNRCIEVDPLYNPHECREFYRLLDLEHYMIKCFEMGNTGPIEGSYPSDDFLHSSSVMTELMLNIFDSDSSLFFHTPSSYEFWFLINKPLLEEEYYQIALFIGFAIFLAVLIVSASYLLVTQKPESEKLSTYECGFEPYEDAKNRFDVQFYIVALLFVLFDIEILLMLPWCLSLSTLDMLGYWSMLEFLLELGLGFIYVWCSGALDW